MILRWMREENKTLKCHMKQAQKKRWELGEGSLMLEACRLAAGRVEGGILDIRESGVRLLAANVGRM